MSALKVIFNASSLARQNSTSHFIHNLGFDSVWNSGFHSSARILLKKSKSKLSIIAQHC